MNACIRSFHLLSGILAAAVFGGAALADEPVDDMGGFDHPVAAPANAFELSIGGGYTQGTGDIREAGATVEDVSGAGGTVELKLGYRVTPSFSFGVYGTFAAYTKADDAAGTDVFGATAGAYADWHFRPDRSIDPWISLGGGFRGLWISPDQGKETSILGWEIARLQVGVDYRVSRAVALGPVAGASLNAFFTENDPTTDGFENIHHPRTNYFFFSGLQGRFDLGGGTGKSAQVVGQAEPVMAAN